MSSDLGRDVSCTTAIRSGRFVTGPRLLAEADYRRLTTPRGMLRGGEEEQNYGRDLLSMIGSVRVKQDAAALPGQIRSELMKDERHESVRVVVTRSQDGPATTFLITIDGDTAEGPFTLAIKASDVTVELLGIKVGDV